MRRLGIGAKNGQMGLINERRLRRYGGHFIDLITSRSELDATRQNICRVRPLSDEAAVDAGV